MCMRTGAAPEEQSGPVCWEDLDLPAMLRCFCAKQQRHYLVGGHFFATLPPNFSLSALLLCKESNRVTFSFLVEGFTFPGGPSALSRQMQGV
eukprot:scaffold2295_cov21-Tisochrysis_lutea.AAC.1